MNRVNRRVMVVVVMIIFALGCEDKNYITNVMESGNSIIGRITPGSPDYRISVWQAREIASTTSDEAGYFALNDIPAGIYGVKIVDADGHNMILSDIEVTNNETTSLGTIEFSDLIWPIVGFSPADSSENIGPLSEYPKIVSAIRIDTASLRTNCIIEPAVTGRWDYYYYYDEYNVYSFQPDTQLAVATQYTVTILPELKFLNGAELGDSMVTRFTTDSFRIIEIDWDFYSYEPDSIPADYDGELVCIDFNCLLDKNSIAGAVNIEPEIDYYIGYSTFIDDFCIYIDGGLNSGQEYSINIGTGLKEIGGTSLTVPQSIAFKVREFVITGRNYPSGLNNVPPVPDDALINYYFSAPVDISAGNLYSNISVSPPFDFTVDVSQGYSSNRLEILVDEYLMPESTYTITFDSAFTAADGSVLGKSESISITVDSLRVIDYGVPGSYSTYYRIIDAKDDFDPRIRLNVPVALDVIESEISIEPHIEGFWIYTEQQSYPYTKYLYFCPTEPYIIIPDTTYKIIIAAGAALNEGVAFSEDKVLTIGVRPVNIAYIFPSLGYDNFSQYNDVDVIFNASMDRSSTEAAFQMQKWDGTPIDGTFDWSDSDTRLSFDPLILLEGGAVYRVDIDTTAQSTTGHYLSNPGYTFFRVRE